MWSGTEPLSGPAERKETMRPNVMIVAVEQVLMLVCHFAPPLCSQDDAAAAATHRWDLHYAAINIYCVFHPGLNRIILLFVITLMMTFLSDCCSSGWWQRKRLVFLCAQSTRSLSDISYKYSPTLTGCQKAEQLLWQQNLYDAAVLKTPSDSDCFEYTHTVFVFFSVCFFTPYYACMHDILMSPAKIQLYFSYAR